MNDSSKKSQSLFRRAPKRCAAAAVALALAVAFSITSNAEERAVKSKTAPIYPEVAKRVRAEGTVVVAATIDADGKVVAAKASSGNAILGPAAEDAVRQWVFERGSGKSTINVEVIFHLGN